MAKNQGKQKQELPKTAPILGTPGFSVYCFEKGSWTLLEDRSERGFVPGPPPAEPGSFDGYCVKVTSVRGPGGR
jgi:hypothetical protein